MLVILRQCLFRWFKLGYSIMLNAITTYLLILYFDLIVVNGENHSIVAKSQNACDTLTLSHHHFQFPNY